MAKRYVQQEMAILQANPSVKAVRENRHTLTYEFRLKLWQQWKNGESLKNVFTENNFDLKMIGNNIHI